MSFQWQWRPRSALVLTDPPSFANIAVLRLMLSMEGCVALRFHGDRMQPLVRDGETISVRPMDTERPVVGAVVVAGIDDVPDLYVVLGADGKSTRLGAPSDPASGVDVDRDRIIGTVEGQGGRKAGGRLLRSFRRVRIDLTEALRGPYGAPAGDHNSVLAKYSAQAPFYRRGAGRDLDGALFELIRASVIPPARVLVVGSGVGTESMALARRGYDVIGVDGALEMVRIARAEAQEDGLDIDYRHVDVTALTLPAESLNLVLFTYDVYSFLSGRSRRVEVLQAMHSWLRPGGAVLLSARMARGWYEHAILTAQWVTGRMRGERGWGRSHTRWITPDGGMCRSFVQVFVPGMVAGEAGEAGFEIQSPGRGHAVLRPADRESDA